MNLVNHVVVEVLSEPYKERLDLEPPKTIWKVDVKVNCYGRISETTRSFDSRKEAEEVTEGYTFLA